MSSIPQKITANTLSKLEPLSTLSLPRLEELAVLCSREQIDAGRFVFHEGDTDNETIYLLSGEINLQQEADGTSSVLAAGSDDAVHPVADKQPRRASAMAVNNIEVVRFDNDLLDIMMTWDEINDVLPVEGDATDGTTDPAPSGLGSSKGARAFQNLPPANIEKIRERMETVELKAGDTVMNEGDAGDYYYLIESGTCSVYRQGAGGQMLLAELGPGDSMGEEALVSNNPRNATIKMKTDGRLLRLGKDDFDALMREPMMNWIELNDARALVNSGKAKWLDVRTISEFRHARVTDAIFCPLRDMRRQVDRLSKDKEYVCYCKTGKRSSAAAYILNERGLKAHVLKGGLQALPDES